MKCEEGAIKALEKVESHLVAWLTAPRAGLLSTPNIDHKPVGDPTSVDPQNPSPAAQLGVRDLGPLIWKVSSVLWVFDTKA